MEEFLFNPRTYELPANLILVPFFIDKEYYRTLRENALNKFNLLTSEILIFRTHAVITGFLGYPNILTLLEFVRDIKQKNIFFLGTAGSINEKTSQPASLNVTVIHSTDILDQFSNETSYPLKNFESGDFPKVKGVTVDIIQRETLLWLKAQVQKGMHIVEMELFPLRAYLEKPFHAIVVTTDILRETGGEAFPDRGRVKEEFVRSFEYIVNYITGEGWA